MRDIEKERGRDTGRGSSRLYAGNLMWDSILAPQNHALSQRQVGAQPLSHPGIPRRIFFKWKKLHCFYDDRMVLKRGISGWLRRRYLQE